MIKKWTNNEVVALKKSYQNRNVSVLTKILDRSSFSIYSKAHELKISRHTIDSNINFERRLNDSSFVYLLGFIWGDGHVRSNNRVEIQIKTTDADSLKEIFTSPICFNVDYPNKTSTRFYLVDKSLKKFLEENDYKIKSGCSADKILSLLPQDLQHYFVRGYFDADGCCSVFLRSKKYPSILKCTTSFSSCFNQDWLFLKEIFNKLNIKYKILRRRRDSGSLSELYFSSYESLKIFYGYLYRGKQFGLKRKQNKFKVFFKSKSKLKCLRF